MLTSQKHFTALRWNLATHFEDLKVENCYKSLDKPSTSLQSGISMSELTYIIRKNTHMYSFGIFPDSL